MSGESLLDRSMQREILLGVRRLYPDYTKLKSICAEVKLQPFAFNIGYLEDHGLIQVKWVDSFRRIEPAQACITAKGIDFLEDDGGLSAILGVVTVKLHEDTLKALLIEKIEASVQSPTVRANLIAKVKSLPAEMTKEVALAALKTGLSHVPDIAVWLGKQFAS
ncbi:hypothetical protein F9K96_05365 [Brucella anthropi]|uniref:hypothetical protein n=1 Tax=Brucella anthropi TaxID=529 RepID=UPI00124D8D0F|nr:hypothetical protein [Brucella anthropi]KAB2792572.1 hypothetical protein F9K96_05365 [Brucella anthropi]